MRFALALLLMSATPAFADSKLPPSEWANRQLPDARQEAQAMALMHEIRCLVCQGQSVADSDAELAGDMRALIRQRMGSGESAEEVRAWLIQRYGDWVSFDPPVKPLTWPLWAAPIAILIAGGFLAARKLRGRR
ncbi:cytochrome c-type biogenesis protein [Sphingomonas sp. HDW15A]|uniref:cytochrome c-type biogenesis protein n=1 Tax=Sphingomonas sp. HDW15A TaxID=2714942 RepID=UPI001F0FC7B1|nr:cytochrome c-type biogenesis protein [Sphingomonas sp. HDW15A]